MLEKSSEIGKLAGALAKAQAKIRGAVKDAVNTHFNSRYTTLQSVWEACREPLAENELSISQYPGMATDLVTVTTVLMHSSGEFLLGMASCKPRDLSPQSVVAATTYLRRAGLAAAVGVAPDDDDGNQATGRGEESQEDDDPIYSKQNPKAWAWLCQRLGNLNIPEARWSPISVQLEGKRISGLQAVIKGAL